MRIFLRPWMRPCAVLMVIAAAGLLLAYGFSGWTLLAAALLLACPVAALWAVLRLDRDLRDALHSASSEGVPK